MSYEKGQLNTTSGAGNVAEASGAQLDKPIPPHAHNISKIAKDCDGEL